MAVSELSGVEVMGSEIGMLEMIGSDKGVSETIWIRTEGRVVVGAEVGILDKCQYHVNLDIIFCTYQTCMLTLLFILTPKVIIIAYIYFCISNNVNILYLV